MGAAVVAAVAARAHRELLEHFRLAGATRPEAAVNLPDTPPLGTRRLERWLRDGVVREAPSGGYWLDEQALARSAREQRRVKLAIVIAAVVLLAIGAAMGLFVTVAPRAQ